MVVYFKDWAEIEAYEDPRFGITGLTPAEQALRHAAAKGLSCVPYEFDDEDIAKNLPQKPEDWDKPDPTRHIRANVLRFVLLQEVRHNVMTEAGTKLFGAHITGELNLRDATIHTFFGLIACQMEQAIAVGGATFHSDAFFQHSILPSLSAEGAMFTGQLVCNGARFEATDGRALNLQGAQIGDSLFLRDIESASAIHITGATIKGQLVCKGSRFEATKGIALSLQGAQIGDGFYFGEVRAVKGRIDLTAAQVGTLADDAASWALVDDLILDGFRYGRIAGNTKPTFAERMEWLKTGSAFQDEFNPQPYTQLADTYKRAGHDREAREVRVTLARKLAEERITAIEAELTNTPIDQLTLKGIPNGLRQISHRVLDKGFDWVAGYGFKPTRTVFWLIGLIALASVLSFYTWRNGEFAPNSAPILVSKGWLAVEDDPSAAIKWSDPYDKVENPHGGGGQDWETFNSFAYAADIVIPIVEIGQTSAWAPSPARGPWGTTLWWARWVFTAAGWIISALGAAAITGVIRRE